MEAQVTVTETRMDVDSLQAESSTSAAASQTNVTVTRKEEVARASSLPPILGTSRINVGYVYSSKMMMHSCSRGHHEEQPERISRIFDTLKEADCLKRMKKLPIRPILREEALLVHSEILWDKVLAIHGKSTDYSLVETHRVDHSH